MAIQVQLRRGNETDNDALTGAQGELTFDTTNNQIRVHDGSTAGGHPIGSGLTSTSPNLLLTNTSTEDTDGGRESLFTFKGKQSGGELSTLAQIQASHDGTADDEKGDLIFRTNDGSDGASPTEAMRIQSDQKIGIGTSSPATLLHINSASDTIFTMGTSNATADARIQFRNSGGTDAGGLWYATNSNSMQFRTNSAEAMRIDSDGRVGIGVTPASGRTLHLHNSSAPYLHLTNSTTGSTASDGTSISMSGTSLQISNREAGIIQTYTNGTERMRIASDGMVGIGNTVASDMVGNSSLTIGSGVSGEAGVYTVYSNSDTYGALYFADATSGAARYAGGVDYLHSSDSLRFFSASTERARIDSSGNLLVGKTSADFGSSVGFEANSNDTVYATRSGASSLTLNRKSSGGTVIDLRKDNSSFGSIGNTADDIYISSVSTGHSGVRFHVDGLLPVNSGGGLVDNQFDLGHPSYRWDDVYATNGTIQTSDERKKQQIASLTSTEITAATAISKLFKTFKWNESVESKGDNARTHTGVIAQQVETAMSDAGLNASNYSFFTSSTCWEIRTQHPAVKAVQAKDAVYDDDGNLVSEAVEGVEARDAYEHIDFASTKEDAPEGATELNVKGIRYPELLAFIGAATEQRLTSIEARLTALEG